MDKSKLGAMLMVCGFGLMIIAFIGFAAMAAGVRQAGYGSVPFTCLFSFGGVCGIAYGVIQFQNSLAPMIPIAFWLGGIFSGIGIIVFISSQGGDQNAIVPTSGDFSSGETGVVTYNAEKWTTLIKYDDEIRRAAEKVRRFGPQSHSSPHFPWDMKESGWP